MGDRNRIQGAYSQSHAQAQFHWVGSFSSLAVFEKMRNGTRPTIQITLEGELCYLLPVNESNQRMRTDPERIFGNVGVSYPTDVWVKMLRTLGIAENVLIEIPLPKSPPSPWDDVWKSLVVARNAFELGGETAWKACVTEIRTALEQWRNIEAEDLGPVRWSRFDGHETLLAES